MIAHRKNKILYFQFPLFAGVPNLTHGIFTRIGGCSPWPYESLNISRSGNDAPANVQSNRHRIADCLEAVRPMIYMNQVHGTEVVSLKCADAVEVSRPITGDALITDIPGMPVAIQLADCQSILLYDPVRLVIANVHSGWRGSIQDIVGQTIRQMQADFCCDPADIRAAVSPSLGPCCSEFKNYPTELPKKFWRYRYSGNYFNFWDITRDQLTAAGLLAKHMELAKICTRCNDHLFFSYRKTSETGRFAAVIGIVDPQGRQA